jgi:hypothetical protein
VGKIFTPLREEGGSLFQLRWECIGNIRKMGIKKAPRRRL